MKDYLYYKQHNQEWYDDTETNITNITPKEAILLKCIQCKNTYSNAYKCKESSCPLYDLRKYSRKSINKKGEIKYIDWMKRPHTCSQCFLEHRVTPYRITNISNQ